MFVFFLCVGRYLEMRARHRAGDLVRCARAPDAAFADRVEADGSLLRVGRVELVPGDRVVVADGGVCPPTARSRAPPAASTRRCCAASRRRSPNAAAIRSAPAAPVVGRAGRPMRVTRVGTDTVVAGIVALDRRAPRPRGRAWRARVNVRRRVSWRASSSSPACTAIGWALVDPSRAFAATVAALVARVPMRVRAGGAGRDHPGARRARGPRPSGRATRTRSRTSPRPRTPLRQDRDADRAGDRPRSHADPGDIDRDARARARRAHWHKAACIRWRGHSRPRAGDRCPRSTRAKASRAAGSAGSIDGRRYRLGRADFALASRRGAARISSDARGPRRRRRADRGISRRRALAAERARRGRRFSRATASTSRSRAATPRRRLRRSPRSWESRTWIARQSPADKLAWLAALRAGGARVPSSATA